MRHTITLFSILTLLLACSQKTSDWHGTITEKDDVTTIKNPIEPLSPEIKIIFEEDLTIGAVQGDENFLFGKKIYVNIDDAGNFYVTDWDRKTVRKYDSDGGFLQSIGGPGQGPGEFQDISEVRFDFEGNIYLNDVQSRRISSLSKTGDYLNSIRAPGLFEYVVKNSQGFYIARSADNVELGQGKKWDYFYGLFDDNFNLLVEFLRLPQEDDMPAKNSDSMTQLFANSLSREAYAPFVNYVLDKKDLIYFGYPKDYEIKVYFPEGKLKSIIQRDYVPVEIDKRHKDHFVQNLDDRLLAKMPAGEEEKIFALIQYPKYKPAYERFILMENDWIFVIVDSVREESKLIDIFDKDGVFLTQFETDIPIDWLTFANGKVYAVATIDDFKFVKRYNYEILGYGDN